jgi:O-antigen/teichoic acid export membrane protein
MEHATPGAISDPIQVTRTAQNATALAVSTILARGLQFAWVILLGRMISVADYGTWGAIGAMITTAASIPDFGMGLITLRDVARRPGDAGRYLGATVVVQPLLALVAYLGLILVVVLMPGDTPTRLLIALAGVSLIVDIVGTVCYNQLLAAERMVATSAISILHIVLQIGFAFAALAGGAGLPGLYGATILAGLLRAALFWAATLRLGLRPVWPIDAQIVRGLFRGGLPLAVNAFLYLAYQHVNKVIVFALLSSRDAGYLTAAFIIVFGVVDLLNTTVVVALYPAMSRLAQSHPDEAGKVADRLSFLTLVMTVPLGIALTSLSSKLAALLFPGFVETARVLEVLIWHAVLLMVGNFYSQLLIVQNRQSRVVIVQAIALALNIVLNFLLLPAFGVQGAGLALFIAQAVVLVLYLFLRQPARATLRDLGIRTIRVGIAGLAMAAGMAVLGNAPLIVTGVLGVAIYAALVILLRVLLPGDWAMLRTVVLALPVIGPVVTRRLLPAALQHAHPKG